MQYLITGATGNIGARVVARLRAQAEHPRLFVRDTARARAQFGAEIDIAPGDLADGASLRDALRGIDALFLVSSGPELAAHDRCAAEAAARAGVKRIVKLSALGARASGETTAVAHWHAQGEAAIAASGVPYTFIQSVGFMSNALAWAASIKAQGVVRASTGEGKIAMIHPDDIAQVATCALTDPRWEGQGLAITGPRALSYAEMTASIGAAIDRPLLYQPISDDEARANLARHGLAPALAEALVALWREVREGKVAAVTDCVWRVTGQIPRSFATWANENAAAFREP